ncbi:REJ domain-containing protein, partial [Baffinella frigidus]
SEAATAVAIVSSTAARTVLSITPPPYTCAACSYAAGEAIVDMGVVSRTDASRAASSRFSFWTAPTVSAIAMDPLGLQLAVTFDHATDRAGMTAFDQSCARVFLDDDTFAKMSGITAAKCVWATDTTLNVMLGVGATLLPGDTLTLHATRVRSANLVSLHSRSAATTVSAPAFRKEPSLSVSGPTTIDQCALLNLKAASDSPRSPDFAWRCRNHLGVDSALRAITTGEVNLAAGTPEMTDLDFTYEISVTATDMFGSVSKEVVFKVFKASAPAPQLYFQPASVAVTRDQMVEVRAVTVFSQCTAAKSEMVFQWTQVSGPTTIPARFLGTIAQLRIPPGTLRADATYVVALTVSMSDDVSKQSSSQMVISVGSLPLIARITGGVTRKQSTSSALALDAGVSRDPDIDSGALLSLGAHGLAFFWACSLSDGTSSQACRDSSGALLSLGTASTLYVPAGTMPATTDAPYQFTVTVSKGGKSPAAYTLALTLVAQAIPNVELAVSGEFFRQTDGSIKINANSVFSLTASCSLPGAQSWSIDPSVALTAPAFSSPSSHALLYLGEGSNALVPGARYLITSECTVAGELETATGSAEQVVVVNSPPAGAPCRACFVDGDATGACATTGEPVFDLLRVSCDNWADSDGGLLYRFGYQVEGDYKEMLFEWSSSPSLDMRLPTGTITLAAQVKDALGALSPVMTSRVEVGAAAARRRLPPSPSNNARASLIYTDGSDDGLRSRRLLSSPSESSFDWAGAADLMATELLAGNLATLNEVASSLILEVDSQARDTTLTPEDALGQKEAIFAKLEAAAAAVNTGHALSQGYACTSLNLASTLSADPAHLTPVLVDRLLAHVALLVGDEHTTVASLTPACAASAITAIAHALRATGGHNRTAGALAGVMGRVEAGVAATLRETAAGLIAGQAAAMGQGSNASLASVARHTLAGRAWAATALPLDANTPLHQVGYTLPSSFAGDANLADADVTVLLAAFFAPPAFGDITPLAPIVTLLLEQDGAQVPVKGLPLAARIRVTIPLSPAHRATRGMCVYVAGGSLSSSGVSTVENDDGSVTCLTTHLTSFTVVPYGAVQDAGSPAPVTPAPPPTTSDASPDPAASGDASLAALYVEMAVRLPLPLLDFSSEKHTAFRQGVASVADVTLDKVAITSVKEVATRRFSANSRRLLASSVEVDFRVAALSKANAQSLAGKLDISSLNTALAAQGLPAAEIVRAAAVQGGSESGSEDNGGAAADGTGGGGDGIGIGMIAGAGGGGAALLLAGAALCVVWRRRGRDGKLPRGTSPQSRSSGLVHPEPQPPADADAATFEDYTPPELAFEPSPVMSPRRAGSSPRRVEPAALDASEQPGGGPTNFPSGGGPKHRRPGGPTTAWAEPPRTLNLPDTAVFQTPRTTNQASAEADEWEPLDIQEQDTPDIQERVPTGGVSHRTPAENAGTPPRDTSGGMLPRSMGARLRLPGGGVVDDPGELDEWQPLESPDIQGWS